MTKAKVLVVEDDVHLLEGIRDILEMDGYSVLTAENGDQALGVMHEQSNAPDLIVSDIMMPKMGGLAAIRRLRRTNPQIRIIAVSGLPSNRKKVLLAGANVFLSKPYTTQELLMAFRELIEE